MGSIIIKSLFSLLGLIANLIHCFEFVSSSPSSFLFRVVLELLSSLSAANLAASSPSYKSLTSSSSGSSSSSSCEP